MCLIVWNPGDGTFSNKQFKNMLRRNRHGLGIMWREDGRVKVEKSLGTPHEKFEMWRKHREAGNTYAMHARLTTHGLTDEENCHPYEILNMDKGDPIDLYVMHNGVIPHIPEVDKTKSDTWHFVEYVIKPIVKSNLSILWDNGEFATWLSGAIGKSKLLFMRSDLPEVFIFNEDVGTYKDKCWLSNTMCSGYTSNVFSSNTNSYTNYAAPKNTPAPKDNYYQQWSQPKLPALITKPSSSIITPAKEDELYNLRLAVASVKSMSMRDIKAWIKEDPSLTVEIITKLYPKNTMTPDTILDEVDSERGLEGLANLLINLASYKLYPIATTA